MRQFNYQKVLTCLLPFLVTKGSRVLEEKVNETEVSKTVFSHLTMTKQKTLSHNRHMKMKNQMDGARNDILFSK